MGCITAPKYAPSDVGGGGGTNRELTVTWTVSIQEFYNTAEENALTSDVYNHFNCMSNNILIRILLTRVTIPNQCH